MTPASVSLGIDALCERWRRPKFRPQCTHITMSRLYGHDLICDYCRRPGQFGWVYRCSQDREDVIEFALSQGYPSTFDILGDHLVSRVGLRKRSRAARESSLSFFDEITPQQMTAYRPDQIATILKQRDNVHTVISAEEARRKLLLTGQHAEVLPHPLYHLRGVDPWTEMLESECEYQICAQCRPGAADRTFLSLNAVANDEIMPGAATGFGFHVMGGRPIADARIVRNIGCLEEATASTREGSSEGCLTPGTQFLDLLHGQIDSARDQDEWDEDSDREGSWPPLPQSLDGPPTRLKHSPRYENLSIFSETVDQRREAPTKHPWTPPPSPSLVRIGVNVDTLGEDASSPNKKDQEDAWRRKQVLQDLDRIYELLGGRQPMSPVPFFPQEGVTILEESAECGVQDIIKQV